MEIIEYQKLVKKHTPKENKIKNMFIAFVVGGSIGVVGELLLELYSYLFNIQTADAIPFMIITLIFLASLFTALGFFDNAVSFAKAGLIVPITGFAHAVTSSALEHKNEGLITGLGSNIFKLAGSVILYGVVAAYVFGIIRFLIFGG